MNKLSIDMRTSDPDELLVALNAEVTVDGIPSSRAIRACERDNTVIEVWGKDGGFDVISRSGDVRIRMLPTATEEALKTYRRLRGLAEKPSWLLYSLPY